MDFSRVLEITAQSSASLTDNILILTVLFTDFYHNTSVVAIAHEYKPETAGFAYDADTDSFT